MVRVKVGLGLGLRVRVRGLGFLAGFRTHPILYSKPL